MSSPQTGYPSTILIAAKKMQSFRRPGSSKKGELNEDQSDSVRVQVPTVGSAGEVGIDQSHGRTLLISGTGHAEKQNLTMQGWEVSDTDDASQQAKSGHYVHQNPINDSALSMPSFSKFITGAAVPKSFWIKTRSPVKKIAVNQDVLATYHESFLYGKVSLSTKVRAGLRGPFLSTFLLMLECIAALLLLALYVRTTYTTHELHWIINVQFICSFFFLLDYIVKLYSAPVRLYYAFSLNGLVDLTSTLPVFFISTRLLEDAAIPQIFLVFRVLRAAPLLSSWLLPAGAVAQEIFVLIAYCLGIFTVAAGVLQWVEWRATPRAAREENGCAPYGCLSFPDALYFVIVTVSTVGYGDITLKSDWGRLIIAVIIITAIIFIPVEINKLLELASRRPYGGKYAVRKIVGSRYIIVSGNFTYQAVEDFLSEFYHPSHAKDMGALPLRMVIMAPFKPSFEMKVLLTQYKGRVDFIEGTPLKNSDLERVSANIASAFFLMADHFAKDQHAADAAQIMRALSVHRYCGSNVRLIVEMLKPENQDNPIWDDADGGIEIVCPEAISYQLLARSCQIKGISTLVVNLFKAGLEMSNPMVTGHWMQQYCHGQQQEIYPVVLPSCFYEHDLSFEEVAEIVYLKFEIILFGLDILVDDGIREVMLFPRQRLIQKTDIGLVIAKDLSVAEKVSTFCNEWSPCFTAMLKKFGKKFKTKYENDDLLIHHVTNKRQKSQRFNGEWDCLESRGKKERFMSFGMMSLGHRADVQARLREIVCTSDCDKTTSVGPTPEQQQSEPQKVYSLQDAVERITQWPPLRKEKPDYPVLAKRADEILRNLEERTVTLVDFKKPHVLVCMHGNWPENVFCFVAHLRSPSLPNPPIVILHPHKPSAMDWGCVGMFHDVYFIQGSPIHEIDLLRAGVLQAEKVVVLAPKAENGDTDPRLVDKDLTSSSLVIVDIDNILIAATIERLLRPVQGRLIVELHQETEIQFLRPKLRINPQRFNQLLYNRNRSATFLFAPAFVEGKGFCRASLTFLLYALFFNRNTVAITEKLISGGDVVEMAGGERVVGARLEQVPVPSSYEGRTFGELWVGLLYEKHWLALGLYRSAPLPPASSSPPTSALPSLSSSSSSASATTSAFSCVSYVYTNPPRDEVLLTGDLLYVLSI